MGKTVLHKFLHFLDLKRKGVDGDLKNLTSHYLGLRKNIN